MLDLLIKILISKQTCSLFQEILIQVVNYCFNILRIWKKLIKNFLWFQKNLIISLPFGSKLIKLWIPQEENSKLLFWVGFSKHQKLCLFELLNKQKNINICLILMLCVVLHLDRLAPFITSEFLLQPNCAYCACKNPLVLGLPPRLSGSSFCKLIKWAKRI